MNESYKSRINQLTKHLLKESEGADTEYEKFFQSALEKFGADSPADLDDEKKKEFFDYVDKNYQAKNEAEVPDSPGQEDAEANTDTTPDEESALREFIRQELRSMNESISDEDLAAAQKLGKDVVKVFDQLDQLQGKIKKDLTDFNSPGFENAIKNAFKIGMQDRNKLFDKAKANKILTSYLNR